MLLKLFDLNTSKKLQNLVLPSGLGYDKSNNRVRTPKVNDLVTNYPHANNFFSKHLNQTQKRSTSLP